MITISYHCVQCGKLKKASYEGPEQIEWPVCPICVEKKREFLFETNGWEDPVAGVWLQRHDIPGWPPASKKKTPKKEESIEQHDPEIDLVAQDDV